jgi:Zn-dependent protease with chaperone function
MIPHLAERTLVGVGACASIEWHTACNSVASVGVKRSREYRSPDPNAFATGWNRDHDMVTLALMQGVLNTFVILVARVVGSIVDRGVFRSERGQVRRSG